MSDKDSLFQSEGGSSPEGQANNQQQVQSPAGDLQQGESNIAQHGQDTAQLWSRLDAKDAHIEVIQSENAELRAKAAKIDELEQRIDDLMSGQNQQAPAPEQATIDPDTLVSRTLEQLSQRERITQEKANMAKVKDKLVEIYGEKAEEKWVSAASANGFGEKEFTQLAATNPSFILEKVLSQQVGQPAPAPTHGSSRTPEVESSNPKDILSEFNLTDYRQYAQAADKLRQLAAKNN